MNYRKVFISALIALNIWVFVFLAIKNQAKRYKYDCLKKDEYLEKDNVPDKILKISQQSSLLCEKISFEQFTILQIEAEKIQLLLEPFEDFLKQSKYKNLFPRVNNLLISGDTKAISNYLHLLGFHREKHFKFFRKILYKTDIEHVTLASNGLLINKVFSDKQIDVESYLIYAPAELVQIHDFVNEKQLNVAMLHSIGKPNWYYMEINE